MSASMEVRWLALEGPSLAGKTTLARRVGALDGFTVLPEYTDEVAVTPDPDQPSCEGQVAAFRFFMSIEQRRCMVATTTSSARVVLLDRSVDTLLAHAFALDAVRSLGCYHVIRGEVSRYRYVVPDLTLYVDVDADELLRRRATCAPRPALLLMPEYNAAFRKYFAEEPLIARQCRFLSAETALDVILSTPIHSAT